MLKQEEFNKIADLRYYLLHHPDQQMVKTACLHYLGDDYEDYEHLIKLPSNVKYAKEVNQIFDFAIQKFLEKTNFTKKEAILEIKNLLNKQGITKENLSESIEEGVQNGYSVEKQMGLIKLMFLTM